MARIRTIKPSFWRDEEVSRLKHDERLFLVGLISLADDDGRFVASQSSVCGYIYPHEEITPGVFKRLMKAVVSTGIVELYDVRGLTYGWLPKYRKHQRINRPQQSDLPEPPQEGLFSA